MGGNNSHERDEEEPINLALLSSRELADSLEKLGSDYKEYRNAIINSGVSGKVIDELETTEDIQAILKDIKVHSILHTKVITTHLLTLKYGLNASIHNTPRMKLNFSNKSLSRNDSRTLEPLDSPPRNNTNSMNYMMNSSSSRNNLEISSRSNGKYGIVLQSPSKGSAKGNITFENLSTYDDPIIQKAQRERLLEPYTYMKKEDYYGEQNDLYHPHGKGIYKYSSGSVYEGEYKNGIPHGRGKIIWNETFDSYAGDFYEGIPHGEGIYSYHQLGEEYEGEFLDGKQHGIGIYRFNPSNSEQYKLYEGQWYDNIRTGKGKMLFLNDDIYEGDFKDGFIEGIGKYLYNNGNIYDGQFEKNKMHGRGKFEWKGGARAGDCYYGDFYNNKRHGQGIYLYNNRDRYDGEFKEGEMNGYGKFKWNSGATYTGQWKNDKKEGDGLYIYYNGDQYKGLFKDNEMHGVGEYTYSSGSVYTGEFSFGDMNGKGILKFADGDVFFGLWKDDKKNGYGRYIYCSNTFFDGDYIGVNTKQYKPIQTPTQEQLYIINTIDIIISKIRNNIIKYYGLINNNTLIQIKELFIDHDKYENGTLTLKDFEKVLLILKLNLLQEDILKIFHYFNRNDNGLDYKDLLYVLNNNH